MNVWPARELSAVEVMLNWSGLPDALPLGPTRPLTKHGVPTTPGHYVYGHYDAEGRLVYVGKTSNPVARTHHHACNSRHWQLVYDIKWERRTDSTDAWQREIEVIEMLEPHYNRAGIPGRRRHKGVRRDSHLARERARLARDHAPDPQVPADLHRALAAGYPLADLFAVIAEQAAA